MTPKPTPISGDHKAFAQALVALAREHGAGSLTVTFSLGGSKRWRDETWDGNRISLSWSEGRHGSASRISLRAEADETIDEAPATNAQAGGEEGE